MDMKTVIESLRYINSNLGDAKAYLDSLKKYVSLLHSACPEKCDWLLIFIDALLYYIRDICSIINEAILNINGIINELNRIINELEAKKAEK